jgi:coenzyme F420-reducing hydrogenase beta subunit
MNLSFLEQDIVELLIFQPRCACEIAEELNRSTSEIEDALNRLALQDLVQGSECGEVLDEVTGHAEHDAHPWKYCGGSVSEFFNYALTKGVEDGQRIYC